MFAGSQISAQHLVPNEILNRWYLNTYVIEGDSYPPSKHEKEDYFLFMSDMSFDSKSEGKVEQGRYILNINGAYLEMVLANGEMRKAYIVSLSKTSLILKFDMEEIRGVEVHYTSFNYSENDQE
jgi:hypothetical protein